MKALLASLLVLVSVFNGYTQDSTRKWQPTLEINLTTVPTIHVSGIDTGFQNSLSVAPSFSIRNQNGFGIAYAPEFLINGSAPKLYMHMLTAGIEQYNKPNYNLVADYMHYFFTNSSLPFTPITNEVFSSFTYKKSWIRPVLAAGVGFGSNDSASSSGEYDIGVAAGIGHAFEWNTASTSCTVIPSILVNAGTNQYFSLMTASKYISHSRNFTKFLKNKNTSYKRSTGKGRSNTTSTGTTASATSKEHFSLSNIELNTEVELEAGSVSFRPVGSIYIPVGSAAGSGTFGYWQLVVAYNF